MPIVIGVYDFIRLRFNFNSESRHIMLPSGGGGKIVDKTPNGNINDLIPQVKVGQGGYLNPLNEFHGHLSFLYKH